MPIGGHCMLNKVAATNGVGVLAPGKGRRDAARIVSPIRRSHTRLGAIQCLLGALCCATARRRPDELRARGGQGAPTCGLQRQSWPR